MKLHDSTLGAVLADLGRVGPRISGSTASLIAAQLGAAMARMALAVSGNHERNNIVVIERLDSISAQIAEETERDRTASAALIGAYQEAAQDGNPAAALMDATREPLAAAHSLIDLLELLRDATDDVLPSVTSDYYGGAELVGAAYTAVMLAVENNIRAERDNQLRERTALSRSALSARYFEAMADMRKEMDLDLGKRAHIAPVDEQ